MSPMAAPHPCTWPGCGVLVRGPGRCETHRRQERTEYEARRITAARRGYGGAWQQLRRQVLARDAHLCVECAKRGLLVQATDVDHIIARRRFSVDGNPDDPSNLQSLCKSCHSRKTAMRDGRWEKKSSAIVPVERRRTSL